MTEPGRPRGRGGAGGRPPAAVGRPDGLPHPDELVDELLPEEVEWERLVRTYPTPALAIAAAAGLWLGLRKGPSLLSALTGFAAAEMTRHVNRFLGDDVL